MGGSRLTSTSYYHTLPELPSLGEEYRHCKKSVCWPCLSHRYLHKSARTMISGRWSKAVSILESGSFWGGNDGGDNDGELNLVWRWAILRRLADRDEEKIEVKLSVAAAADRLRPAAMWRFLTDRDVYRRVDWWGPETAALAGAAEAAWAATMRPGVTEFS